jgi:hypothetical protein
MSDIKEVGTSVSFWVMVVTGILTTISNSFGIKIPVEAIATVLVYLLCRGWVKAVGK